MQPALFRPSPAPTAMGDASDAQRTTPLVRAAFTRPQGHLRRAAIALGAATLSVGAALAASHTPKPALLATLTQAAPAAPVASAASAPQATPPTRSAMDAELFYQVLVAEVRANRGDAGSAYQIYLEAARRLQNAQLYQRAVEVALRARAGEEALTAAKAWRQALPRSRDAAEFNTHILLALGRSKELAAPLRALIQLTPSAQQPQLIASLPRSLTRLRDRVAAARVIDEATEPWRAGPLESAVAWGASAEAWLMAGRPDAAMASARRALKLDSDQLSAQLVAIDLIGQQPDAEQLVRSELVRPDAPAVLRLAYARKLATAQRYGEAAEQLEMLLKVQPDQDGHRVLLAAIRLEMRQIDAAEEVIKPVLQQTSVPPSKDQEQAFLLMAQVADRRNHPAQALQWLDKADPKHEKLSVQGQRARLLAAQGRLSDARNSLRKLPETEPRDAVLKIQAEAQLLRELKQWREARNVLEQGLQRFPEDTDLLYDQAMVAEKLKRFDEMEQMLRKVIALAPDNAGAYNALGYSFAERSINLPEARKLIEQALALRPGDAYIMDSLGWVAFREGKLEEARKLLADAYASRQDAEIAAHLGEVLWLQGDREGALRLWREAMAQDKTNETLKETLQRLGVQP